MTTQIDAVSDVTKKLIIEQKIAQYQNSLYDLSMDVKIARVLKDKAQEKAAEERMKPLLIAIELLETELNSLEVNNESDS